MKFEVISYRSTGESWLICIHSNGNVYKYYPDGNIWIKIEGPKGYE